MVFIEDTQLYSMNHCEDCEHYIQFQVDNIVGADMNKGIYHCYKCLVCGVLLKSYDSEVSK